MKKVLILITLSFLFLILQDCRTPPNPKYIKDGKPYGVVKGLFRERWWNFYERGVSFSEGEFWKEAINNFQEALKQRDKDQRRARTYGMHFTDYFPHRELGVAYYYIGEYENALKQIKYSLSSIDTGKAKFYLNKIRQALIKNSATDRKPPRIRIDEPGKEEFTNKFSITIQGEVEDDTYASSIMINNKPLFIELSAKKISFAKEIKLKKGANEIRVTSKDLTGKTSKKIVKVIADFVGPSININNYMNGEEVRKKKIVLKGSLSDDNGIASLEINQIPIAFHNEKEVTFSRTISLRKGENKIKICSTDIAGNETKGELVLIYASPPVDYKKKKRAVSKIPIMLVNIGLGIRDTRGNPLFAKQITAEEVETHPIITMKELTESQTVYYDTIFIDGTVAGTSKITHLEVNGEPIIIKPGKNIFFSYLSQLKKGENIFTFKAIDVKRRAFSRTITIIRKVPQVMDIGSRMAIAILPFVHKGKTSPAGGIVNDGLIESFTNLNRFNIVSRGAALEAILKELKLSQTDLVDKSKALKVGKLVAAESVLYGSVIETKKDIEIISCLINTETSTVMATKDVYGQDKSLSHIHFLLNGLALKFRHALPVLDGLVVKVKGKEVFADLGKNTNLKKEMKFIIYRQGEKIVHPVTGKVLGCDTEILGEAKVVQVLENLSKGKMITTEKLSKIKKMDRVITK